MTINLFVRWLYFLHVSLHVQAIFSCVLLLAASANINAKAVPEPAAKPINGQYAPAPGPVSAALVAGPAKPYSFAYEVIDPAGGNAYGHRETSDGVTVEGEYRVVLPDTRTQIVTWVMIFWCFPSQIWIIKSKHNSIWKDTILQCLIWH